MGASNFRRNARCSAHNVDDRSRVRTSGQRSEVDMAAEKRRVDVNIMGMSLAVRTEREDAWIHGLAGQLSRRLEELKRAAPRANAQQLAVLVALNLAEELAVERDNGAALAKDARAIAERALAQVETALSVLDDASPAEGTSSSADDAGRTSGPVRVRVQAEA